MHFLQRRTSSQILQKLCSFYRGDIFIYKFSLAITLFLVTEKQSSFRCTKNAKAKQSRVRVGLVWTWVRRHASPTRNHEAIQVIVVIFSTILLTRLGLNKLNWLLKVVSKISSNSHYAFEQVISHAARIF